MAQLLDHLNPPSSAPHPWEKVTQRLTCIADDPACRSNVLIHAALLLLILILAIGHKAFLAIAKEQSRSLSKDAGLLRGVTWPKKQKFSMALVDSIMVYPIKSASGVRLNETWIARKGIELDRRWIVLKWNEKNDRWEKIILKDEPKMVLIQTAINTAQDTIDVSCSPIANKPHLKSFSLPIKVNTEWELLPNIEMYGDAADGRVVQQTASSEWKGTVSEWVSDLLGYKATLVQYDPEGTRRAAFPLFRGEDIPHSGVDFEEMKKPRGIEFADEYPLLVASTASLTALQAQVKDAVMATDGTDGRGGNRIGGEKLFNQQRWRERILAEDAAALKQGISADDENRNEKIAEWLPMLRFRPNIILKSCEDATMAQELQPWEEDEWAQLNVESESTASEAEQQQKHQDTQSPPPEIHIAARCQRCLMTTVDPASSERIDVSVPLAFLRRSNNLQKKVPMGEDGLPLQDKEAIANAKRGPCFGVYAVVPASKEGMLRVGDVVRCAWRRYGS